MDNSRRHTLNYFLDLTFGLEDKRDRGHVTTFGYVNNSFVITIVSKSLLVIDEESCQINPAIQLRH
jgi:hypothetical protein